MSLKCFQSCQINISSDNTIIVFGLQKAIAETYSRLLNDKRLSRRTFSKASRKQILTLIKAALASYKQNDNVALVLTCSNQVECFRTTKKSVYDKYSSEDIKD